MASDFECVSIIQIYDNAYKMLEKAWEKNKYCGFGTKIHKVPHDTTSTDFVTDRNYVRSKNFLAKSLVGAPPELVEEFQDIMGHFSATLYRWEFRSCRKGGCRVCQAGGAPRTPLDDFYKKFEGNMPTPIPVWASFPGKSGDPVACLPGENGRSGQLHYRMFADLMKLNVPSQRLRPDQHYDGPTSRHVCPECVPEVCHRSAAGLARHIRMVHTLS